MADDIEGQVPTEGGQESQSSQGQEPEKFDAEYVRRLRAEAASYRTRLKELEVKVAEHETAKLSETEKLQRRLADLEREQAMYQQERQERTVRYETMLQASRLGIVDPEAAYRLLDLAKVEFDENGSPRNIEPVLKELIKAKPYLVAQTATPMTSTNPARNQSAVLTRDDLKKLSQEEINTRWEEVSRVLAEQH